MDPDNPDCSEGSAYPAAPDSEYGWEKLFSERMYAAYSRNYGLNVRIARFHNIFGPEGTWRGGREKAPAAICRKVAEAEAGGEIEIWGDGKQTRTFLYVDECLEGVRRLMDSDFSGPVNIGSDEMVSITQLAELAMKIADKPLRIKHIEGPLGVRRSKLGQPPDPGEAGVGAKAEVQTVCGPPTPGSPSRSHRRGPLPRWRFDQAAGQTSDPGAVMKLTIVTPSYNHAHFIERTIASVLDQGYPDLEYIVVDGGSTDGTVNILSRYSADLIWTSEKDRGQSDAINKGLAQGNRRRGGLSELR